MEDEDSSRSWAESVRHTPTEALLLIIQQYCRNIDMEEYEYWRRISKRVRYDPSRLSGHIHILFGRLEASMKNDNTIKESQMKDILRLVNSNKAENLLLAKKKLFAWLEQRGLMFDSLESTARGMMRPSDEDDGMEFEK